MNPPRTPALSARVREHIRTNVVGYIALFCFAIGGTAAALPGKNNVDSGDIKAGNVKASDLGNAAVTNAKLADAAVDSRVVADNSLTGTDIDESSLSLPQPTPVPSSLPPSGPAGGDLSGEYPNPLVAQNAIGVLEPTAGGIEDEIVDGGVDKEDLASSSVGTDEVINDQLSGQDIAESSLVLGTNGISLPGIARATYDVSGGDSGAVGTHGLNVSIPDNAIVLAGIIDIITPFVGPLASISVQVESADDVMEDPIVGIWDNPGPAAVFPRWTTDFFKTTASQEIEAIVSGGALTAGKFVVWLVYVQSD